MLTKNSMKINYIFSIFSPKDTKFFPLFYEAAEALKHASDSLPDLFKTDSVSLGIACKNIKHAELDGDKITANIHKVLCETFITPFDREDIDAFADALDDCIDGINHVAQKVLLYSPKENLPFSMELAGVIQLGVAEICESVKSLETVKKSDSQLRKNYKEIKRLEELADSIYEKAITTIFREDMNPVELIKQKEILFELERTMNRIISFGKILNTIFIKYA